MSFDPQVLKKRRNIMLAVNAVAVLGAGASAVGYFQYAQSWALIGFAAALVAGFGAQIWFIAGLRSPSLSSNESARGTRVGKGV
jgi:hypothetical protein